MNSIGTLYLMPAHISGESERKCLPPELLQIAEKISYFIVENEKSARHFLKSLGVSRPIASLTLSPLNEHTKPAECEALLKPVLDGQDAVLLSEAGCPCVADPGSNLVRLAQKEGVRVVPLVGPSSILLSLMASGLNGQSFAFHGYVPVDGYALAGFLKEIESDSRQKKRTQIFMDTPYRTQKLFDAVIKTCQPKTRFCIALDVTGPKEKILTKTVAEWNKERLETGKCPAMFLVEA